MIERSTFEREVQYLGIKAEAPSIKGPLAVPYPDSIFFAEPPLAGSYWPVVTSYPRRLLRFNEVSR